MKSWGVVRARAGKRGLKLASSRAFRAGGSRISGRSLAGGSELTLASRAFRAAGSRISGRTSSRMVSRIAGRTSTRAVALILILGLGLTMAGGEARAEKQGARLGSLATAAAPLHSEKVVVGEKTVEVGFYMWPLRADQAALLFVQGPIDPVDTSVVVEPAGKNHASAAHAYSRIDQTVADLSWHEVTVGSRGDWALEVHAGKKVGRMPLTVQGPPEMPVWLAWVIGLSPLLVLAYFLRALRGVVFADDIGREPWWVDGSREVGE